MWLSSLRLKASAGESSWPTYGGVTIRREESGGQWQEVLRKEWRDGQMRAATLQSLDVRGAWPETHPASQPVSHPHHFCLAGTLAHNRLHITLSLSPSILG